MRRPGRAAVGALYGQRDGAYPGGLGGPEAGTNRTPEDHSRALGVLGSLEYELEIHLGRLGCLVWESEADLPQVLTAIGNSFGSQDPAMSAASKTLPRSDDGPTIEPEPDSERPRAGRDPRAAALFPDRPICNDDPFYIERKQDEVILDLAGRPEQTLVIKGPHQTGKNSLLLQYLSQAQSLGKGITFVDFKTFSTGDLERYDRVLTSFTRILVRQLRFDIEVPETTGQVEIVDFMERRILPASKGPTVLAFDEVDRVFGLAYQRNFFTMLRLWHEHVSPPLLPGLDRSEPSPGHIHRALPADRHGRPLALHRRPPHRDRTVRRAAMP